MGKWFIFVLPVLLCLNNTVHGQTIAYKKYTNNTYHVSFDVPDFWTIKYSKAQFGFVCVPVTKAQIKMYKDCFEGIVFRLDFYKSPLDSVLLNNGNYTKAGDIYFTSDRFNDSIKTQPIKGATWKGIYHNNVCGINCKSNGEHAAAGQCQFFYFSNDTTTVCINTNGKEMTEKVYKKILGSFQFTE